VAERAAGPYADEVPEMTPASALEQERQAVRTIMSQPRFAAVIEDLAARTGSTPEQVREAAARDLDEMAAQVDPRATEAWDRFGQWLSRSYTVDSGDTDLGDLRALGRQHSLVFLPNHRSYLDPLILRTVLERAGFPPNHILGGINLALWPMSSIAKRSGLVFIRRQTRDDPVYPAMMREYLGFLLRIHANLEWYFEGGRTRTGKLRPPRMGVLRYLLDAFLANGPDADDVYLVPVAVVYDQQHEVEAISFEESGGTKRPESLGWLWRFARAQSRGRGRAHVRFGPPLSLRAAIDDAAERGGSTDATVVVPRVAFEIAHRINDATPITPAALVTFSLLDNDGRALTQADSLAVLEPLLAYIRRRSLPLTSDVDLARPEGLRRALRTLVREGVVEEYDGGLEPVFAIARSRQHEAGFYRNTVLHYFIYRAIAEVAAVSAAESGDTDASEAVWREALRLRDLLKYEFFFPRKRDYAVHMREETDLARPGWETERLTPAELAAGLRDSQLLLGHRVVGPFLEAYQVVADRLAAREPAAPVDRDDLVAESLGYARQRWLQQRLHSPESISKDLMTNAVRLAGNRGLLGPGDDGLRDKRAEFAAELADAVRCVGVIREIALANLGQE
jgi:glycerol-3-phosphate O-acyltransferase